MSVEHSRPDGPAAGTLADDPAIPVPEAAFDAIGDAVSRTILRVAAERPRTPEELARAGGVSVSTVYRRLDSLTSLDLVERVEAPVRGEPPTYRTVPGSLTVAFGDGSLVARRSDGGDDLAAAVGRVVDAVDLRRVEYDPDDGTVTVRLRADGAVLACLLDLVEHRD
jgi:DNA-binding transcriptional ArsR family regulator